MRIPLTELMRNVLEKMETKKILIRSNQKKQLRFLGYIRSKVSLEYLAFARAIEGKMGNGRQRITYSKSLCKCLGGRTKRQIFVRATKD